MLKSCLDSFGILILGKDGGAQPDLTETTSTDDRICAALLPFTAT
jgi:hypothetical protein